MKTRRLLSSAAFLGALVTLILTAAPATADPVSDAASTLSSGSSYYLESGASVYGNTITIDATEVKAAFGTNVKAVILKTGTSTIAAGDEIEKSLNGNVSLVIFSGTKYNADSSYICKGTPEKILAAVARAHVAELKAGNFTSTLVAFAQQVTAAPIQNSAKCTGRGSTPSSNGNGSVSGVTVSDASGSSGGSGATPWLIGLGGLAVVGGGGLALNSSRKKKLLLSEAKANVMPYYDRLASDVNTLNPGDNEVAQQAIADASERYTSAGSQMATATTVAQWAAVRRTTLEGLMGAQTARKALGLDPGPELPPLDNAGQLMSEAQQVTVQGKQYQGYPQYTPGAPHYFGGGGGYPGGWYSFPFWETIAIGSILGGGVGGWGFGGGNGYGNGYNQGYSSGYDAGQDNNGGGSGWAGMGGGGDTGWGGMGGGGDFSGGGDFGGGGGGGDGGSF